MRRYLFLLVYVRCTTGACISTDHNSVSYTCTLAAALKSYGNHPRIAWIPDVSSGPHPTLSVNGLDPAPLQGGPFQGGRSYLLWFGATGFQADSSARVSVKDFDAQGDGTSDDTAAVQAALNTHALVFLPAGTYNVTNLQISEGMQGLEGEGITSKLQTVGGGVAITVSGQYHILRDFFLNGRSANSGGIQFGSSEKSNAFTRLTGVQIRGFTGVDAFGVGLYAVQELEVLNCPLDGNYNDIAVLRGPNAYVTTTVIGGPAGHIGNATNNGIYIGANAGELTLRDAVIESNAREDILVDSGIQVTRLILDGCYFEGGNTSGMAQALIAIRGKAGAYRQTSLLARGNIFHMPARKSVTLFLDRAISQIAGNWGIFETGGAVTTVNSRSNWIFNNESPSAADLQPIYAALAGSNYVLDRSYGEYPQSAFQMGGVLAYPGAGNTAPVWGRYGVRKVASGSNGCAHPSGCWLVTGPQGNRALQDVTSSTMQQVALVTLPANGFVSHTRISTVTAFTGPSTVLATVGFSAAPEALVGAAYNLSSAVSPGNLAEGAGYGSARWRGEQICILSITGSGKGLDRIVAGAEVAIWIEWAVLP